jgi:hypothetical protein
MFPFDSWPHNTNVIHFAQALASTIEKQLVGCKSVRYDLQEYGPQLHCEIALDTEADLWIAIQSMDKQLNSIVRNSIISDAGLVKMPAPAALKPDEAGAKWWVRYVGIPLLVVALAALGKLVF